MSERNPAGQRSSGWPYPLTRRESMILPASDRMSMEKLAAGGPDGEDPPAAAGGTHPDTNVGRRGITTARCRRRVVTRDSKWKLRGR